MQTRTITLTKGVTHVPTCETCRYYYQKGHSRTGICRIGGQEVLAFDAYPCHWENDHDHDHDHDMREWESDNVPNA